MVVMLSSTLAVLLIICIVAAVKVVQILEHLKRITEKAENFADKAEVVSDMIQKTAGPLAIGRLVANIADSVFQSKRTKSDKKEKD